MKIGVIGATGKQGNLILQEAIKRGHTVTAIVRNAKNIDKEILYLEKDLFDLTAEDLKSLDWVVDAFNTSSDQAHLHQISLRHLTDILKDTETRLAVVGGAGSLYVDEAMTKQLFQTPDFPDAFKPTATNMNEALNNLKTVKDVDWVYVSPAADFQFEGEKSGQYQIANEVLTLNSKGESTISYADYALGFLDIIESGKYTQERVSLVSK